MLSNARLKELFVYEPSGTLRRIGGRKLYPWRNAGVAGKYLVTTVDGGTYYLHRLVWQYHKGYIPHMVDHVNGDTKDNRIENLRECSNAENQHNSKIKSSNKSGFKGVVFHRACKNKPWQAKIVVDGKLISLGYYKTAKEAGDVYAKASIEKFGEFAFLARSSC